MAGRRLDNQKNKIITLHAQQMEAHRETIEFLQQLTRKKIYRFTLRWERVLPWPSNSASGFVGQLITFNSESIRFKIFAYHGEMYCDRSRNGGDDSRYFSMKYGQLFGQGRYDSFKYYSFEEVTDISQDAVIYFTWDYVSSEVFAALKKGRKK